MYNGDCEVYIIRYFNVWFYLFAKTETDNYKIKMLGEHISAGNSMKMKDIHWWCTRHSIKYQMEFEYRKEYPIRANIWNFYSYCRFKLAMSYRFSRRMEESSSRRTTRIYFPIPWKLSRRRAGASQNIPVTCTTARWQRATS